MSLYFPCNLNMRLTLQMRPDVLELHKLVAIAFCQCFKRSLLTLNSFQISKRHYSASGAVWGWAVVRLCMFLIDYEIAFHKLLYSKLFSITFVPKPESWLIHNFLNHIRVFQYIFREIHIYKRETETVVIVFYFLTHWRLPGNSLLKET